MLKTISLSILTLLIITFLPNTQAYAAGVGRIAHTYGPAWVQRGITREKAEKGFVVLAKDTIITGSRGRVKIIMGDGSKVYIGAKSRVSLRKYSLKGTKLLNATVNMFWGKVRFFVNKLTTRGASFNVRTSTAVLGVRGTEFIVIVLPTAEVLEDPFRPITLVDMPRLPTRTILTEGGVDVGGIGDVAGVKMPTVRLTPGNTANVGKDGHVEVRETLGDDVHNLNSPNAPRSNQGGSNPTPRMDDEGRQQQLPIAPKRERDNLDIKPDRLEFDNVPEIDHTNTNNAIQNLESTTEIKITPSFVQP